MAKLRENFCDRIVPPALSPFVCIRTHYYPANLVSGDSYYLQWQTDGTVLRGFLIDVSGHGVATALQTASVVALRREAVVSHLPLVEQVQWVNSRAEKYFAEGSYATLLGFELDLSRREVRYVCAGISKFFINGREILTPGMFVGMWADAEFEIGVIPVAEGDCLHFLTDGFTDALAQPERAAFWSPRREGLRGGCGGAGAAGWKRRLARRCDRNLPAGDGHKQYRINKVFEIRPKNPR